MSNLCAVWTRTEQTQSDFKSVLFEETGKQCSVTESEKEIPETSVLTDTLLEGFEVITNDCFENEVEVVHREGCNLELKLEEKLDQSEVFLASDSESGEDDNITDKDLTSKSFGYRLRKHKKMIIRHDIVLSGKNDDPKPMLMTNKISKWLICPQNKKDNCNEGKEDNTTKYIMNENTRLILSKMIQDGILNSVDDVINVGEQDVTLHATLKPEYNKENFPKACVVKVFTSYNCKEEHKYVNKYHLESIRKRTSKSVQWWAKREMINLLRIRKVGIRCPQVIKLKQHILVMSFIGKGNKPAPQLKYARLRKMNLVTAYEEVKDLMKVLYEKTNLIHGNLTEESILWHDGHCYLIDVSHCMEPSNENSFEFLYRDCVNIISFFGGNNCETDSPLGLFKFITGFDFGDKLVVENMRKIYRLYPNSHHLPSIK